MRFGWSLFCGLLACQFSSNRAPEELGYRVFVEAVQRGDLAAAWGSLSEKTRHLMEARAKAVADASKGAVKEEPALMLFQSGIRPAPAGDVKVLESDGGTAVIEVNARGVSHHIVMVRESGRWVVDLSDIF